MLSIGSLSSSAVSPVSSETPGEAAIAVASLTLKQQKQDGADALALLESASAPPTGDHRGQLVNVMA